jgi:purine-binding chemotaxis protein CheW
MALVKESDRFLLCGIGTYIGALALRHVQETMRPLPIEPLTGAPSFVLGLTIVRGSPTPVIDAARLLGASASSSPSPLSRFVSLKLDERRVALAVDAVLDVRSLPEAALATTPPLLQQASADLVPLIGSLDTKLLLVFEAARLVPDSVWQTLQSPTASV